MSFREELSAEKDDPTGIGNAIDGYLEKVMGRSMQDLMQAPLFQNTDESDTKTISAVELNMRCDDIRSHAHMTMIAGEVKKAGRMLTERRKEMESLVSCLEQSDTDEFMPEEYAVKMQRCRTILSGIKDVRHILKKVWEEKTTHR